MLTPNAVKRKNLQLPLKDPSGRKFPITDNLPAKAMTARRPRIRESVAGPCPIPEIRNPESPGSYEIAFQFFENAMATGFGSGEKFLEYYRISRSIHVTVVPMLLFESSNEFLCRLL
jgi:hypothetical protein